MIPRFSGLRDALVLPVLVVGDIGVHAVEAEFGSHGNGSPLLIRHSSPSWTMCCIVSIVILIQIKVVSFLLKLLADTAVR